MGAIAINLAFLTAKPTGLSTYALNLLPHLTALAPTLLVAREWEGWPRVPVPPNMTAEQGGWGHVRRLEWTQFRLPSLLHAIDADLLFSPIPEAPLFGKHRYAVTVHDLIPLRFGAPASRLRLYFRHYVPRVLQGAACIFSNSVSTAREVTETFGIAPDRFVVTPLACDRQRFRPLGLPAADYFLYLGRHDRHKNVGRLLAAFALLPPREGWRLVLAGPRDARYTPGLERQAVELDIADRVEFRDYVPADELPLLLSRAIALVFPSLWEGFGLPVLEAMACGTPVVTSNLSALPEVAGGAALLVDPYDPRAIAAAMHEVGTDLPLRSQLRQLGLARATEFSWARTGQQVVEALTSLL